MSDKLSETIFNKYVTNKKLLETLDCFFSIETPQKDHFHTAFSYIVEDGVLYNCCRNCDADYVEFLVLPEFTETNYRIELVPGNCTSKKDSTKYMLFEEVIKEIITDKKHIISSEYTFDACVNALSSHVFYSVEGNYNPHIHQSGTKTISAIPATFNNTTC